MSKVIRYDYADVYINGILEKRVFLGDRTKEKKQRLSDLFNSVKKAECKNNQQKYFIELKYE